MILEIQECFLIDSNPDTFVYFYYKLTIMYLFEATSRDEEQIIKPLARQGSLAFSLTFSCGINVAMTKHIRWEFMQWFLTA